MKQLNKVITDYLSAESTDYAIMINGEWGCGKTYYLEHEFKELVGNIKAPLNILSKASKKAKGWFGKASTTEGTECFYKPAFISLYGLSSAEDFYQRVFFGINNWADNGVIRLLGTGISKVASFFSVEADKGDAKAITYVDTNRVLVFDDLERICEDKITIKEVLGLINSYSEHDKRKVIIVCNEEAFVGEEATQEVKDAYKKYKEKSVRYTYTYVSNVQDVYDYIANNVKDNDYKVYLQANKKQILEVFGIGGKENLRTLIFFIDTFQQVYASAKSVQYADNVIYCFMVTTLLYTMEYKRGVAPEDLRSLNPTKYKIDTSLFGFPKENDEKTTKDYGTEFRELYSNKLPYFVNNDDLLDYIGNGYLNTSKFDPAAQELSDQFKKQQITPEGKVFRKLRNYAALEDDDVKPLIDEILGYVDSDKYNIYDLLYVYADLLKCNHWKFSGFKLTKKIEYQIKDSIKRQGANHEYNPTFELRVPIWDNSNGETDEYKAYKEMKAFATRVNYEAKLRMNNMDGKAFMKAASEGDLKALSNYRQSRDNIISVSDFDWKVIYNLLNKGSNPLACELCSCIMFLTSLGDLRPDDVDKIRKDFKPLLDKYDTDKDKRVRSMFIAELKSHIDDVIS